MFSKAVHWDEYLWSKWLIKISAFPYVYIWWAKLLQIYVFDYLSKKITMFCGELIELQMHVNIHELIPLSVFLGLIRKWPSCDNSELTISAFHPLHRSCSSKSRRSTLPYLGAGGSNGKKWLLVIDINTFGISKPPPPPHVRARPKWFCKS